MPASNHVYVEAEVLKATEKALLLRLVNQDGVELWIPISTLGDDHDYEVGDVATFAISQWFADKEGIESDDDR